jgi:hypothetical protein
MRLKPMVTVEAKLGGSDDVGGWVVTQDVPYQLLDNGVLRS